jgi:hypothetical protein
MLSAMSKNKERWKTNMIKTLRITSIIAVVLAVGFFVFPAVFGVRSDEQTERFLNSTGVIEKFNKAKGQKSIESKSQISPLVKQAEAFALYLNPPAKPPKKATAARKPTATPRPKTVSAKFKLIGTSYYASHPELSLALLDEPGKGSHWVRQSGKLGHLIIEQVKDGLVVVRDDKRTFELTAERPKKTSLLKHPPPDATGSKSILPASEKAEETAAPPLDKADSRITRSKPPKPPGLSDEEIAAFREKMLRDLEDILPGTKFKAGLEHTPEEARAAREKLISNLEAMRIGVEEAKRLGDLGKKLRDVQEPHLPDIANGNVQQDPNQAENRKVKKPESSQEPNSPNKK